MLQNKCLESSYKRRTSKPSLIKIVRKENPIIDQGKTLSEQVRYTFNFVNIPETTKNVPVSETQAFESPARSITKSKREDDRSVEKAKNTSDKRSQPSFHISRANSFRISPESTIKRTVSSARISKFNNPKNQIVLNLNRPCSKYNSISERKPTSCFFTKNSIKKAGNS